MRLNYISPTYLAEIIRSTKGKFFTCEYTKKDGTTRKMNARTGVKFNKSTNRNVDQRWKLRKGYMSVYDVQKQAWRIINLETVRYINFAGTTYYVDAAPDSVHYKIVLN